MAKSRKDPKGRVLRKGESYRPQDGRYSYSYTDPLGRRKIIYDKDGSSAIIRFNPFSIIRYIV